MWNYCKSILYRHRQKFLVLGVAVGGVTVLSHVLKQQLLNWQHEHARMFIEQQKHKNHYHRILETARLAVLQLLPNIRKAIQHHLDADLLVNSIKENPSLKITLWEELKVVGFARTVSMIISSAFVVPTAHVMMIVLSSATIEATCSQQDPISVEMQNSFMSVLHELVEFHLDSLVERVRQITSSVISTLPLESNLTLFQIDSILQQILLAVTSTHYKAQDHEDSEYANKGAVPWSSYLKEPQDILHRGSSQLRNMFCLTVDLLNTDTFREVVSGLTRIGLRLVLDRISDFYVNNAFVLEKNQTAKLSSNTDDECLNLKSNKVSVEEGERESASKLFTSNLQSEGSLEGVLEKTAYRNNSIHVITCPTLRVVPFLSNLINNELPLKVSNADFSGRYNFCHQLLIDAELEVFSYSVYEALVL